MRRLLRLAAAALVFLAAAYVWALVQHGFSARDEPSVLERAVAVWLRRASVPREAKAARNPFPASPEILAQAREHFADHCASCHANNGSGDTPLGRSLYPRAPDMRRADTQSLSDGELYWAIHHGIRLSGMPAWGDPGKDDDSWKLVAFIRHLPTMTAAEAAEMERFNPKSPAELEEEERDRRFLAGEDPPAVNQPHHGRNAR